MKDFSRDTLVILILAIAIFFLKQVTIPTTVSRYSCMEPGLEPEQRVLVNKVAYYFGEPERGDVIIFDPPFESEEPFIKRIIGLPGESVEIKQGTVYVHKNGNTLALDEPYVKQPPTYTLEITRIPEGEYFVLGDNRNNSQDSHTGWTVKRKDIIAKAWLSIWPWDRWGFIANPL